MNIKKVEEIVQLMEKHNLTEIEIEEDGVKIHLRKGAGGIVERSVQMAPSQMLPAAGEIPSPPKKEFSNLVEIKAPIVGTFYTAPSPDAAAYVQKGSVIVEGDVICIVEAMKIMNEIKSEVKGKIVDILVGNGEPIEFGQVLFLVDPT